jgi:hypothetical protein
LRQRLGRAFHLVDFRGDVFRNSQRVDGHRLENGLAKVPLAQGQVAGKVLWSSTANGYVHQS